MLLVRVTLVPLEAIRFARGNSRRDLLEADALGHEEQDQRLKD
jgi:hypothetical protein